MELRQLEIFLVVAERGSFTAAAMTLRVNQPALSRSIQHLERDLGVLLFHRLPRGVRLTPAGEALAPVVRKLRRELQAGMASIQGVTELRSGRLEVACLATLTVAPVAPIIGRLRRRYPGLEVRLLQPADDRDVRQLVRVGDCELGFTDLPTREADLTSIVVERQRLMAVLPPESNTPGPCLSLDEFADRDLIFGPAGTPARQIVEDHLRDRGRSPRIAVEVSRRDPLEHLVLAGAGSTLMPEPLAHYAERHGAVVVPLVPSVEREVTLLSRREQLTPAAQAFVAEAKRYAHDGDAPERAPA